jgi:hypothetical protein
MRKIYKVLLNVTLGIGVELMDDLNDKIDKDNYMNKHYESKKGYWKYVAFDGYTGQMLIEREGYVI